ncbi:peroxiredoxin [Companilactobacillus pabuli]|jgi:peroxiredoxin (alkyl hydroperoxide reductase subunit C)|uniref:Alkyl hydroperoxide reductase C n=1 Tax=Companilactobacillus pabuli TaxID=2714036 RepID=A0A7L7KWS9_9LACO|nr:redoxin domain-containing protein [Companilactobacillus pabuli]AKP03763.1 alkyl hydroperoxide reductase [Companilactobacillus farciminis]AKS52068.1 alkyl hydroperoxide reductase [Companilactobacillus farciminis]MDG5112982.1 redoxin domain-containing protein [Companilactobacillus pabuli]QMT84251.1 redoxin domain-containing protein [Companilactobacillus pabuli]GAQ01041.1 peroxiredoxin [Companilactobacillus farciminis]
MNYINKEIPDFTVNAYQKGELKTFNKSDLLGKWSILFFYPADFSFVCPTELSDLQDSYDDFKAANAEIYSCSVDSQFSHMSWAQTTDTIGKIQYPMLSDQKHQLTDFFNILDEQSGQAYRGVFIIDPKGLIKSYTINAMGIGRNAREILRTLQAAQFVEAHGDNVCPANWHPGEETIKPSGDLVGKI